MLFLKWFFNGDEPIKNPVQVSSDGRTLEPFVGPPLTVNGELNKVASNVATGRNIAGVHWRTDAVEAIRLGEAVAISILRDQKDTYDEPLGDGLTIRKFDGTTVRI